MRQLFLQLPDQLSYITPVHSPVISTRTLLCIDPLTLKGRFRTHGYH